MDMKKTGSLIAKLRKERGLSQSDLAEKLDVTNKAISRWETGRGYPDIEMLPKLSKEFGISIQEILDGELAPRPHPEDNVERSLESVCVFAGQQQKRQNKKVFILIILAVVLLVVLLAVAVIPRLVGVYYSVIGSDSCIVAEDYSSLTFCGNRYIPLPMDGYECTVGEVIVNEVQVEGVGFVGKLFFGEALYEVKGVPNNELLYLQTDHDENISDYYVLESKYDLYYQMLTEGSYCHYYGAVWLDNGYTLEVELTDIDPAVFEISDDLLVDGSLLDGTNQSIRVCLYDDSHLFYRWTGDLIQAEDEYYWSPSVFTDGGYYMSHRYYRVSEGAADKFKDYFLYLCW